MWENLSDAHVDLYRKLLTNLGLKLEKKSELMVPAFTGQALVKALALGRFCAASIAEALDTPFIDEAAVRPEEKSKTAGLPWVLETNGGDRFVLNQLKQSGPKETFALYFSYCVYCPLDLSDLLNSGPDLPKVSQHCYVSHTCKLFLNGHPLKPTASTAADYRTRMTYQDIPLKQGWNQFLIKVAIDSYQNADPGTLAVRLFSANKAFEVQLKTAVQLPQSGRDDLKL